MPYFDSRCKCDSCHIGIESASPTYCLSCFKEREIKIMELQAEIESLKKELEVYKGNKNE